MLVDQTKNGQSPAWLALLEAAALFAGIFLLRLGVGDSLSDPITMLNVIPIALLAVSFGLRAALAGSVAAFGTFALWVQVQPIEADAGAYVSRGAVFLAVGVGMGFYAERMRRRDAAHRRAEREILSIIESGNEAFISIDSGGRITAWNREAEAIFGWSAEEAIGLTVAETIVPPDLRAAHRAGIERYRISGTASVLDQRLELPALRRDGTTIPVEITISAVEHENGAPSFHAFLHDISHRKQTEVALREHAEDVETIAAATRELARSTSANGARDAVCAAAARITSGDVVVMFEPDKKGPGLQVTAMHGADPGGDGRFAGLRSGDLLAFTSGKALFIDDAGNDERASGGVLVEAGARSAYWHPITEGDVTLGVLGIGWIEPLSMLPERVSASMDLLAAEAAVAIERASLLERLERIARTDDLTGLPNRRAWEEALPRELALADRLNRPLAVAMIDLDHFKAYNDAHGHQAGDRLLKQSAAAWRSCLRATDVLTRYGGEEFAVLLPACELETAIELVDRMRLSTPAGQTCSAGVAEWDRDETPRSLLVRADQALYAAKAAGRNATVPAEPAPVGEVAE